GTSPRTPRTRRRPRSGGGPARYAQGGVLAPQALLRHLPRRRTAARTARRRPCEVRRYAYIFFPHPVIPVSSRSWRPLVLAALLVTSAASATAQATPSAASLGSAATDTI